SDLDSVSVDASESPAESAPEGQPLAEGEAPREGEARRRRRRRGGRGRGRGRRDREGIAGGGLAREGLPREGVPGEALLTSEPDGDEAEGEGPIEAVPY